MTLTMTLSDVMADSVVAIPEHLDPLSFVPVVTTAPVAQGDLLVMPSSFPSRKIAVDAGATWTDVPANGIAVISAADTGGNDHVLVAAPGTARVTFNVSHPSNLGICMIEVTEPASIQHVEHGAIILDPANSPFECRGQREWMEEQRRVAD